MEKNVNKNKTQKQEETTQNYPKCKEAARDAKPRNLFSPESEGNSPSQDKREMKRKKNQRVHTTTEMKSRHHVKRS